MTNDMDRRGFIKQSMAVSTGAGLGFRFEEKNLLAKMDEKSGQTIPESGGKDFPMGQIGDMKISRVICGGNLISGFAHSRDLIYVSDLLRNYFSDEKIFETLAVCEKNGINSAVLRVDNDTRRIVSKYWQERGGKIQWIAQAKVTADDIRTDIDMAVDNGASAVFIHGGVCDKYVAEKRLDVLAKGLERIRDHGVVSGLGGHSLTVPMECEKAGLDPDFYMKTINSKQYWSAGPTERHDSVWSETPEETIAFMKNVKKPWIGYKVLGAGAIDPTEGFKYAFENGTDFICVGMFDFQINDDAAIAKNVLAKLGQRQRPWCS